MTKKNGDGMKIKVVGYERFYKLLNTDFILNC